MPALRTTPIKERSNSPASKSNGRLPNPEHFPFLAKRLAAMDDNRQICDASRDEAMKMWRADSMDDVNAAAAMLALKHGPNFVAEVFQSG